MALRLSFTRTIQTVSFLSTTICTAAFANPEVYEIDTNKETIKIDGNLDEEAWIHAKIIDQFLIFIETYFIYLIKKIYNKVYFLKAHHGFRRSLREYKNIWIENNFEYQSIYEDLFEHEYCRLRIVRYSKISYLLSKVFFKYNPYLNILIFKKN